MLFLGLIAHFALAGLHDNFISALFSFSSSSFTWLSHFSSFSKANGISWQMISSSLFFSGSTGSLLGKTEGGTLEYRPGSGVNFLVCTVSSRIMTPRSSLVEFSDGCWNNENHVSTCFFCDEDSGKPPPSCHIFSGHKGHVLSNCKTLYC